MMPGNFKIEDPQQCAGWELMTLTQEDLWYDELSEKEDCQNVPKNVFFGEGQPNLSTVPDWLNQSISGSLDNYTSNEIVEEICSPAPSTVSSFCSAFTNQEADSKQQPQEKLEMTVLALGVSDQQLGALSVKDLNRLLKAKGLSKEEQQNVKYRRRTLKNRGYAQNCRIKRVNRNKTLVSTNWELINEVERLTADLDNCKKERDLYKSKYSSLIAALRQIKKGS